MWLHLVTEFYVINSTEFVTKMTKFDLNLFFIKLLHKFFTKFVTENYYVKIKQKYFNKL